jgi:hypothetical protein
MREPAIDPVIVEVPQAGHIVGLAPNSTGVDAVAEEDPRLCVGRKFTVASSTDRTGEEVNKRTKRDTQTFELSTTMSGGPRGNTVVFRDIVGHAEVASSKRPPLLREAGLLESHSGAFDDTPNGAFSDTVGLGPSGDGGVKLPAKFTCRSTKFRGTDRIKTLDRLMPHEGKKCLLCVLG